VSMQRIANPRPSYQWAKLAVLGRALLGTSSRLRRSRNSLDAALNANWIALQRTIRGRDSRPAQIPDIGMIEEIAGLPTTESVNPANRTQEESEFIAEGAQGTSKLSKVLNVTEGSVNLGMTIGVSAFLKSGAVVTGGGAAAVTGVTRRAAASVGNAAATARADVKDEEASLGVADKFYATSIGDIYERVTTAHSER
jgi:hypothetical protein